jgi:hypothetical protein
MDKVLGFSLNERASVSLSRLRNAGYNRSYVHILSIRDARVIRYSNQAKYLSRSLLETLGYAPNIASMYFKGSVAELGNSIKWRRTFTERRKDDCILIQTYQ